MSVARGRFRMPGARYWLIPWFQVIGPYRMQRGLGNLAQSLAAGLRVPQVHDVPRRQGASAA